MKIKQVKANNRKKAFELVAGTKMFEFPYSKLETQPSLRDPIHSVFPDRELGYNGFTYQLTSGKEGTVVMDQVLEYSKDPEYTRKMILFKLTVEAQNQIKKLAISKREIIRRMRTTPTQFYRLIDQRNTRKTIDQMVKLLVALDCSIDFILDKAA